MSMQATAGAGPTVNRALFIASHNHFRSLFCEEIFNHVATQQHQNWLAFSRASRRSPAALRLGPIHSIALDELRRRGVKPVNPFRLPRELTRFDFQIADVVISLDETHDRPIVENRWASQAPAVRYWELRTVDGSPAALLREIEHKVRMLLQGFFAPPPAASWTAAIHPPSLLRT